MYKFVCLLLIASYVQVDAVIDIVIKKYESCEGHTDTAIKHDATFEKINSTVTLVTGSAIVPYDLGEDVTLSIVIDSLKEGEWKELYKVEENNPCKLLNKFGGDVWFELQEKVGVQKGACPLPKGDYSVEKHLVDFSKLPVKTAPKSTLRFTVKMTKGDEVIMCKNGEVESV